MVANVELRRVDAEAEMPAVIAALNTLIDRDIDLPMVTVTASLPGASPAQMETDVARKIENS